MIVCWPLEVPVADTLLTLRPSWWLMVLILSASTMLPRERQKLLPTPWGFLIHA
jgi:hypothetical protein